MGYFDGVVASAVLGVEKPRREIFDEALRLVGVPADRAVMVGNDPVSDVHGAYEAGVDSVFVALKTGRRRRRPTLCQNCAGWPGSCGASVMEGRSFDGPRIERAVREILAALGEDAEREGLRETPARVAEAYARLLSGLHEDPLRHLEASFDEAARDLVLMRGIPFVSVCEHHLLPMIGCAGAAYLPAGRVVGFSEIVRLVEGYAAMPQLQERLTAQVADALHEGLGSRGSLVVVEAEHTCMAATGAWSPGTTAFTSAARGVFAEDPARRAEVTSAIR